MKILMLSNFDDDDKVEDMWIARAFQRDGHIVTMVDAFYDERLEEIHDIILRRETWFDDEEKVEEYHKKWQEAKKRIIDKDIPRINFNGKFDQNGKDYLIELYKKGYSVIPSANTIEGIKALPKADQYLLKPVDSYSGIGQMMGSKEKMLELYTNECIVQPFLKFKSEVQFYFVKQDFYYAVEYTPSKLDEDAKRKKYNYSKEELELAKSFAKLNDELNGVQRIDFLKLENGELKLVEIEDASLFLDLDIIDIDTREKFIKQYTQMVYEYAKNEANIVI